MLSLKLSNLNNKYSRKQVKIKCLLKTKVKFQDKKLSKSKHYKMKLKRSTTLKEILQLQKFKMPTLKVELISLMTIWQIIEELIEIKIILEIQSQVNLNLQRENNKIRKKENLKLSNKLLTFKKLNIKFFSLKLSQMLHKIHIDKVMKNVFNFI